jgi:iron complex transport system substrate-binding protein
MGRRAAGALLVVALGCGPAAPAAPSGPARRVVSLAPSITEIVYALGAGDRLVGVCGQCDYPAEVARVPRVGGYLVPSVEATVAARPDLVFAVPSPGNRDAVLAIERGGVRVLVVRDRRLADVWDGMLSIAVALGAPDAGERLVADVRARLDAIRARTRASPRRRVLMVVGHRPLVAVGEGTLQDELIAIAGGENVAAGAGVWPQISLEIVVERAPEVIVDAAMGTEGGAADVFAGLVTVPAVRDGRIVRLTDDRLFRAGPRLPEAAAALAAAIHPDGTAGP